MSFQYSQSAFRIGINADASLDLLAANHDEQATFGTAEQHRRLCHEAVARGTLWIDGEQRLVRREARCSDAFRDTVHEFDTSFIKPPQYLAERVFRLVRMFVLVAE